MKPALVYPVPMESPETWEQFKPFAERFFNSFRQYPGDCIIYVVACVGNVPAWENVGIPAAWIDDLPFILKPYEGSGCDIGGAQWLSKQLHPEQLMICLTSKCYFHRAGWLERYVAAYNKDTEALYGASTSWEGGKRHICTRAYAMRAGLFAGYPHTVNSREDGQRFEIGTDCITDWFYSQHRRCFQVTFDGEQEQPDWRHADNIFRKGDQSNMLVHDRHTQIWEDASQAERLALTEIASPKTLRDVTE